MTDDDKALVDRLREADDWYFDEPWERTTLVSDAPFKAADRIEAQAAEIDRLREAGKKLHDHATHDDDCRIVTHGSFYPTACTCGYSDAWKAWRVALGETE